jgi:AcrR family transcriptional regulator
MVERIVDAGLAVLLRDGYDAFSTNRVAAEAGISPGSLYQYFPDKAAIVEAVIDRHWDSVADQVAAALIDRLGDQGVDMIREALGALVDVLQANVGLVRVVMEELPSARTSSAGSSWNAGSASLPPPTLRHAPS